jgi:hypothetical protein
VRALDDEAERFEVLLHVGLLAAPGRRPRAASRRTAGGVPRGREQRVPGQRLEALEPAFRHRRHVGSSGWRCFEVTAYRLEVAGLDLRQHLHQVGEHAVDLVAHEVCRAGPLPL